MGAAVSAGAADEGTLVETLRCHACGCHWRQRADSGDCECPSCGGEFVERMGVAVAAPRPRIQVSEETLRQVMASNATDGSGSAEGISMQDLMLNLAQFGLMGAGAGESGESDLDPAMREALQRSLNESEAQPKLPPPASKKATMKLKEATFSGPSVLNGQDSTCVVCSEEYQKGEKILQMPCGHMFHRDCLKPWLESTNSCPVCRHELETDDRIYEANKKMGSSGGSTPSRVSSNARASAGLLGARTGMHPGATRLNGGSSGLRGHEAGGSSSNSDDESSGFPMDRMSHIIRREATRRVGSTSTREPPAASASSASNAALSSPGPAGDSDSGPQTPSAPSPAARRPTRQGSMGSDSGSRNGSFRNRTTSTGSTGGGTSEGAGSTSRTASGIAPTRRTTASTRGGPAGKEVLRRGGSMSNGSGSASNGSSSTRRTVGRGGG